MLRYNLDGADFSVFLTDKVLAHFKAHQQLKSSDTEAGGQLFARFEGAEIWIEAATGPRPTDRRTRTSYQSDRSAEKAEILRMFDRGLHFVGDWHTHPSHYPKSSGDDNSNIKSCVIKSSHELKGFVMIIAGTTSFPLGLSVSLHNGQREYILKPFK